MIDIIRRIAATSGNGEHGETPLQLVEGIVVSSPPNIQIKLKDNDKLIIPSELIQAAEQIHKLGIHTGDQVMVAILQGGQSFFIVDRIVSYGE